jgi:hypothetical protein
MNSQLQADNNSNSHNTIYSYESIRIRQIKHLYNRNDRRDNSHRYLISITSRGTLVILANK